MSMLWHRDISLLVDKLSGREYAGSDDRCGKFVYRRIFIVFSNPTSQEAAVLCVPAQTYKRNILICKDMIMNILKFNQ